jgi:hypothetical protein
VLTLCIVPATAQEAGPADRSGKAVTRAELTAGTSDSTASLTLVLSGESSEFRPDSDGDGVNWSASQLSLTVSSPFDGESDAMPATLDGLVSGTKATLRWGQFRGASRLWLSRAATQIVVEARAECVKKAPPTEADAQDRCRRIPTTTLVQEYLPARYTEYLNAQVPGGALDWGIEGSIGYKRFDYIDPVALTAHDTARVQGAAKLFFAYYPKPVATAITGSIAYQRGFEAADAVTLCPAPGGPGPVTCVSGSPGAPERSGGLLISLGLRHRFFGGDGAPLGVAAAPLVTYDALDEVWGVDVPIYFFRDKKAGLSGGVRGGWRSDDKKVRFGVFIGAAFSLFQ